MRKADQPQPAPNAHVAEPFREILNDFAKQCPCYRAPYCDGPGICECECHKPPAAPVRPLDYVDPDGVYHKAAHPLRPPLDEMEALLDEDSAVENRFADSTVAQLCAWIRALEAAQPASAAAAQSNGPFPSADCKAFSHHYRNCVYCYALVHNWRATGLNEPTPSDAMRELVGAARKLGARVLERWPRESLKGTDLGEALDVGEAAIENAKAALGQAQEGGK